MAQRVYPNLKAFFKDTDETLQQVAKDVGCSMPFLSMIKWGTRQPSLPLALRIAHRCHVPLESLVQQQQISA